METSKQTPLSPVSEIHLSYLNKVRASDRIEISSHRHAAEILRQCWDMGKIELVEQFRILLLNSANKLLGTYLVSSGSDTQTIVDHKLIFVCALKANAKLIILAHNHPSGELRPSKQDLVITEKLKHGAKLLGLQVIDHIILSRQSHISLADEGLL